MTTRPGGGRLGWLCAVLIAVAALWNAREALGFDFVARDDDINIYYNPHLGPPGADSLSWMLTDVVYMRRYVPLGWLAFSAVYQFSGLSPVGYHAANLALHAANSLLVYVLLRLLLRRYRPGMDDTWRIALAALGAALWSLHPFRAESIGWASGLLYGTAGFWALASAVAYARMDALPLPDPRRRRWLIMACGGYALSILSYPMGIALPAVFIAMDFAPRPERRSWAELRRVLVEKLGFIVPGVAVLGCTVFARYELSSFWPKPPSWEEFTLAQRAAQSFAVWTHYLWRTAWPVNLTPAPTWLFEIRPLAPLFLSSAIAVIGITVAVLLRRAGRGPRLLWAAYLGILVPLLGLTEHPHFASDRYAYLASVILILAAVLVAASASPRWRRIVLGAGIATVLGWSGVQRRQLRIWEDMDALLTHELVSRPTDQPDDIEFVTDNFRKWAMFHAYRGELRRAGEIYALAERRAPAHPRIVALRRELESVTSEPAQAEDRRNGPAAARLHAKIALDFSRAGRAREAEEHFRAARALAPRAPATAFNWATFAALHGRPFDALGLYHASIAGASTEEIAPAARARLLALIAEGLASAGRSRLAVQALDAAIAQAERDAGTDKLAALKAQRERYRTADGNGSSAR